MNGIGKAIVKEFYKLNYNIMINEIYLDQLKKIVEYTLQTPIKNNNDTKIAFFMVIFPKQILVNYLLMKLSINMEASMY
jgi:hypothetical protein